MPTEFEAVFAAAEGVVARYFADRVQDAERGTIEISGERYILVRAASLSVEFLGLVRSLYGEGREREADAFSQNILFDLAHALGRSDAKNFHAKMRLEDPIARLAAGPIHFAYSGWASVDISAFSRPQPNEDYSLVFDHPYSFEASAWLSAGRAPTSPTCVMNAGYSSGWCEESFGVKLVATEILCKARGDEACRFVMAHPSRIEQEIEQYKKRMPHLAARMTNHHVPDFFARKAIEEELRKNRDELDVRVKERTAELERANALLKEEMAQRTEAERRLVQAQKLEAVGRLAGGIAHDFNNLLGVILGRSSRVQARLNPDDPLWQDMEAIGAACRQSASLTRHLIAFSRREPADATPLELNELIRSFGQGVLTLIGEDIELRLELASQPTYVLADHAQMEQVLINLVVNARDAMPNGGTLTIRTTVKEAGATVEVSDTGSGMDAETQTRIFDPFFTTKPHGTGLGLSTVYGIMQEFAGTITVTSAPGEGARFVLGFRRCEFLPSRPPEPETRRTPVSRGTARILVVEDQGDLRDTIEETLVDAGYRVIAVGDPLKALDLVVRGDLELDVLVTDLVLPKLGGRELASRISELRPKIRIVYMSGYDKQRHTDPTAAIENAPSGHLLRKPFSIEELTSKITEVIGEM